MKDYKEKVYYNIRDKTTNTKNLFDYMLNRTIMAFEYEGLPETLPAEFIERYIQTSGHAIITEAVYKGERGLWCLEGGFAEVQDPYYRGTFYTCANPALQGITKPLEIGKECVLIYNDKLLKGLSPLFSRYASRIVENDLTIHIFEVTNRLKDIIASEDDATTESARIFYKKLEAGEFELITTNAFLEGVKNLSNHNGITRLTDFIEYEQYLKASWFNDLGIRANYNMKREAINAGESELDDDTLLPLLDNMLSSRKKWVKELNKLYNLNVSVDFASTWKNRIELNQIEIEAAKKEVESVEADPDEEPGEEKGGEDGESD